MGKLFGTDGVRGEAYEPPLDRDSVIRIGHALALHLPEASPRILIGRDTRASGPDIESWLSAGIVDGGGSAVTAGVVPTPAIAYLTRTEGFDAGVVISASHNPYRDNGIKVFSSNGVKSSEALEDRIEASVLSAAHSPQQQPRSSTPSLHLESLYSEHVSGSLDGVELPRMKVALDCANGAGYRVGPKLLADHGLDVIPMFTEPDGENVNRGCGSTDLRPLAKAVRDNGCDLGAALDGDGDRVLMVDSRGRTIDGDQMLLLCARQWKQEGRLKHDGVVATVMSNMALEVALAEAGITLTRTGVGDKYVAQEMTARGMVIGGEQSGHIIFSDFASTGDGLLTLMQILRVLSVANGTLDELAHLEPFPQVLLNVRVSSRPDVSDVPEIARAVAAAERELGNRGRVLIRYSGTEPLLRIMMEGPKLEEITRLAEAVREVVQQTIGAAK